ncbi:hypothetical protein CFAM422_002076, partial [Trichoderma lentiforme]
RRADRKAQQTARFGLYEYKRHCVAKPAPLAFCVYPLTGRLYETSSITRGGACQWQPQPGRQVALLYYQDGVYPWMAALLSSESLSLLLLLVHRSEDGRGRQAEQRPWLRLWTRVAGCGLT